MRTPRAAVLVAALLATAAAGRPQVAPGHALVATHLPGAPATRLFDVDLGSGAQSPLGAFPADARAPLAVAIDRVNGDVILAVDLGGAARIVRLALAGRTVAAERVLADVPGRVTDVSLAGDVFALVGGAQDRIVRVPRNGGAAATVLSLPRPAALGPLFGAHAWIAESGDPGPPPADPGARLVDLATGQVASGPHTFTGAGPLRLTGIADIVTAVPRLFLTDGSGQPSLSVLFGTPQRLQITPVLPPGATEALVMRNLFEAIVLGGAAHPFLKSVQVFPTPATWTILAGPLPGDPVDFDLAPPPGARVEPFGAPCGRGVTPGAFTDGGAPALGNPAFVVALSGGIPTAPAFLALGYSERSASGTPLPIPLPGGCPLLVAPHFVFPGTTDVRGAARQPLPIPNDPSLAGASAFAQWVQPATATTFATSSAVAIHVF
jgi:hypothetical protein